MESHMKMLDYSLTLWREVVEASYDFRRHQRECEHLNFLTLSKVRVSTVPANELGHIFLGKSAE
jgi:hypothetical protein